MESRDKKQLTYAMSIQRSPEDLFEAWMRAPDQTLMVRHLDTCLADEEESSVELIDAQPCTSITLAISSGDATRDLRVMFRPAPAGRGTEVRLSLRMHPPSLATDVASALREDLRNFKQRMEAGECPTSLGQASGARSAIKGKMMESIEHRLQAELDQQEVRS